MEEITGLLVSVKKSSNNGFTWGTVIIEDDNPMNFAVQRHTFQVKESLIEAATKAIGTTITITV